MSQNICPNNLCTPCPGGQSQCTQGLQCLPNNLLQQECAFPRCVVLNSCEVGEGCRTGLDCASGNCVVGLVSVYGLCQSRAVTSVASVRPSAVASSRIPARASSGAFAATSRGVQASSTSSPSVASPALAAPSIILGPQVAADAPASGFPTWAGMLLVSIGSLAGLALLGYFLIYKRNQKQKKHQETLDDLFRAPNEQYFEPKSLALKQTQPLPIIPPNPPPSNNSSPTLFDSEGPISFIEFVKQNIDSWTPMFQSDLGNHYAAIWSELPVQIIQSLYTIPEDNHEAVECIHQWYDLQHPSLVPILGAGSAKLPFFIIPGYSNGTIDEFLVENQTALSYRLHLVKQVADGMHYLHSLNIVHCDLNPRNILIDTAGNSQIFNVDSARIQKLFARVIQGPQERYAAEELNVTGYTKATDVFAFGMVAYMIMQGTEEAVDGERLDGIPEELWKLLESCWHCDPEQRPTFDDISKSLDTINM